MMKRIISCVLAVSFILGINVNIFASATTVDENNDQTSFCESITFTVSEDQTVTLGDSTKSYMISDEKTREAVSTPYGIAAIYWTTGKRVQVSLSPTDKKALVTCSGDVKLECNGSYVTSYPVGLYGTSYVEQDIDVGTFMLKAGTYTVTFTGGGTIGLHSFIVAPGCQASQYFSR